MNMIQHFRNLKIKSKLISAFITITIVASLAGIISCMLISGISTTYDDTLVNHGFAQGDIGKALSVFIRMDENVHDSVNYFNDSSAESAYKNVQTLPAEFEEHMAAVKPTLATEDAKRDFDEAMAAWEKYKATAVSIADEGVKTDDPIAIRALQGRMVNELDPLCIETYNSLFEIMDIKVNVGNENRGNAVRMSREALIITIVLVAAALVLSGVIGVAIAGSIAKPMAKCCERLDQLSRGDLKTPVPQIPNHDELGQLADSTGTIVNMLNGIIGDISYLLGEMANRNFNIDSKNEAAYQGDLHVILESVRQINRTLSTTLSSLGQSAEQVACGADQVSVGAQSLAQGTTEQASAVEELSATITEIDNAARNNAKTCEGVTDHSRLAGEHVEQSTENMKKMVVAMDNISKASEQIGKIIATIEDIAFQTNILALNAAVEAARAGSAGKGFAVVADEVRNLAGKSDEAAKATKVLIENAIGAVEDGETNVKDVNAALDETRKYASQVSEEIQILAASVAEQSEAIAQVTEGIDQISSVVQTNSATSEESAAASEELSSQAELMKKEMLRFKLRDVDDGGFYAKPAPAEKQEEPAAPSFGGDKY